LDTKNKFLETGIGNLGKDKVSIWLTKVQQHCMVYLVIV
jgi:hypothetical protein